MRLRWSNDSRLRTYAFSPNGLSDHGHCDAACASCAPRVSPAEAFVADEAVCHFLGLVVVPDVFRDRPGSVLAVEAARAERVPVDLVAALRIPGVQVILHDLLNLRVEHRG